MGLQDIFTAVQDRLYAVLMNPATLSPNPGPPAPLDPLQPFPEFLVGSDKLMNEGSPPRIVWVPGVERMSRSGTQGGDGVRNPRPLKIRFSQVQAHVWDRDLSGGASDLFYTERLANRLDAALHDVCHGVYEPLSGAWDLQQPSATRFGMVYVLTFEVQVPFTREPDTYALVSTMPITPVLVPPVATG